MCFNVFGKIFRDRAAFLYIFQYKFINDRPVWFHNVVRQAVGIILIAVVYAHYGKATTTYQAACDYCPQNGIAIVQQGIWATILSPSVDIIIHQQMLPVYGSCLSLPVFSITAVDPGRQFFQCYIWVAKI